MSTSHIEQLKIEQLTVDPALQRQRDFRRERLIADEWDPRMVGVLTVSHRAVPTFGFDGPGHDEAWVVIDGQTRRNALELVAEGDPEVVPVIACEVFEDLSRADEAAMFLRHNNRKAVTPRDHFRLAVAAEQEWALNIRDIAADHGWYVQGMTVHAGDLKVFTAIGAVEKVYDLDEGRALRKAFSTIERAWGRKTGSVCSETIYGLGLLFASHPTGIDAPGLASKLEKTGLNRFISAVGDRRRTHPGMSIKTAAQQWTVELYNRGRRTHRV